MFTQLPALAGPAIVALHGLGHGGALIALAWIAARPGTDTGSWTVIASGFWTVSLVGFVAAALGIAGIAGLSEVWSTVAAAAAIVSLVGIGLFLGNWPAFNTVAAVVVNIAILASLVGVR